VRPEWLRLRARAGGGRFGPAPARGCEADPQQEAPGSSVRTSRV